MTRFRSSDRPQLRLDPAPHHVLLLRLWTEPPSGDGGANQWRCSLEDPRTGQRRGFASVVDLIGYLVRLFGDGDRLEDPSVDPTATDEDAAASPHGRPADPR